MSRLKTAASPVVISAAIAAALAGCASKPKPAAPPPDSLSAEQIAHLSPTARAAEAQKVAVALERASVELQSAQPTRQRPALRNVFDNLARGLPLLVVGPRQTGVFSHQLGVVTQVRDQLANRPERLDDTALVDDGLQASYNALRDLAYSQVFVDDELTKQLDELSAAVGRLRQTSGMPHNLQAVTAVVQTSQVVTKMAQLAAKQAEAVEAAMQPTTSPAATEPAIAPGIEAAPGTEAIPAATEPAVAPGGEAAPGTEASPPDAAPQE